MFIMNSIFYSIFLLSVFAAAVSASPLQPQNATLPPLKFKRGKGSLPILELPYGKFQATKRRDDVYTFKNIPYAAPPTGNLRWQKPQPPRKYHGVQDGARHEAGCCEVEMDGFKFDKHEGEPDWYDGTFAPNPFYFDTNIESEDCLFLDITVPKSAVEGKKELPVVVFIFGGGFVDGRKEHSKALFALYDGLGLVHDSHDNVIFVTFNYRVGAFGFLAGKSFEEQGGVPNVGLWDQRAVFQWVKDHISKVGGDPKQVTAMGHSAGAASIMYHLTAQGGTLDPMFQRAILLSPANQPMWDRDGMLEERFRDFEDVAYCKGKGLSCLREANTHHLQGANKAVARAQVPGNFAWGPYVDGSYIRNLPVNELAAGNHWPLDALMMSHVKKETQKFWPQWVMNNANFKTYLESTMPQSLVKLEVIPKILEMYPDVIPRQKKIKGKPFYDRQEYRVREMIRDSCITCNIRWMLEAYGFNKTWIMNYNVSPADHGKDLTMTFFSDYADGESLRGVGHAIVNLLPRAVMRGMHKDYKSYIASFIRAGDPNVHRRDLGQSFPSPPTIPWKHPRIEPDENFIRDVLHFEGNPFRYFLTKRDKLMPQNKCDFWKQFYKEAIAFYGQGTPFNKLTKSKPKIVDAPVVNDTSTVKVSSTSTKTHSKTSGTFVSSTASAIDASSNTTASQLKVIPVPVANNHTKSASGTAKSTQPDLPEAKSNGTAPTKDTISKRSPDASEPYFKTVYASVYYNDSLSNEFDNAADEDLKDNRSWSSSRGNLSVALLVFLSGIVWLL